MSTAATKRPTAVPAPIPVPRRVPQRRWRPGLIALAVALVAVGGLVAAYAVTLVGKTGSYLAVSRPVEVGAVLSAADITTVRITVDPGLRPIPAAGINRVVGRHAAVELVAGTLITDAQLTDASIPGPGQSLVGLGLAEDRLPAGRIKPGSAITLVATPIASAVQPSNQQTSAPQTFTATVVDVRRGARDGTLLVNVAVSTQESAAVAALAASDRLVIVLGQG